MHLRCFFIGLKMFLFFAGFPESIDIYTDRKVRKIYFFRKKILFLYIFTVIYRFRCVDYCL